MPPFCIVYDMPVYLVNFIIVYYVEIDEGGAFRFNNLLDVIIYISGNFLIQWSSMFVLCFIYLIVAFTGCTF